MTLSETQQSQVDDLRVLVGDVAFDDDALYGYVAAAGGSLDGAAAAVWRAKASDAASLVDVQEGSSKRPLSQLAPAALRMASFYQGRADATSGSAVDGRTRSRPIAR